MSLLVALAGCSKGTQAPKVATPRGGSTAELDAGSTDASLPQAGKAGHAAGTGGNAAGAAGDSATGDDAGTGNMDPTQVCAVADELSELALPASFGDAGGFSVTPGLTGFGVALMHSGACDSIQILPVTSLGAYKTPQQLLGDCTARVEHVSLLHLSDGYRLSWVDNSTGSAELQTSLLPESLDAPATLTRTRVTDNALHELRPVQASFGGNAFLSWIALDPDKKTRDILLRAADASGDARTLVTATNGYNPTSLALTQLGSDKGALAFVSEQTQAGVWLLPLSGTGEPSSDPVRLSADVTADNTVDLATREQDGGAVLYAIDVAGSHEVRFRRLTATGSFASDEIKVVSGGLQGRDASLARLGGGYVVVFRNLPGSSEPEAGIRLMFVTKEGNLQRDAAGRLITYPVASASTTGGRVSVRVSTDGQLLIGFLDASDSGPKLRLIRKRLDCAF